jgi:hypothetical protein
VDVTFVERVIIGSRLRASDKVVTDKVVPSRDLAAGTKASAHGCPGIVDPAVDNANFDALALIALGVDAVGLDLGEVGEASVTAGGGLATGLLGGVGGGGGVGR